MSKLPARTGVEWLRQGFALFRRQPGLMTTVAISNVMATLVLTLFFPLIGPIAAVVLGPSLNMAILQACAVLDENRRIAPGVLLTGFRKPQLGMLSKLGLLHLAITLVLVLIMAFSLSDEFIQTMRTTMDPAKGKVGMAEVLAAIPAGDLVAMRVVGALNIASWILLYFATPLVFWKGMKPFKAAFYSVFAVLGAAGPFLVMLLVWCGALFGCLLLVSLLLGQTTLGGVLLLWVVLLFWLLLQCGIYAAYRQIFGAPDLLAPPA